MTEVQPKRRRRRSKETTDPPPNRNRKIALSGVFIALFVGISVAVWVGSGGSGGDSVSATPIVVPGEDRVLGDANASVLIKDFSDFRCPHCADAALDLTPDIVKNYVDNDKVAFEFVPVAILGDESFLAAQGSMCAEDQGQFWAYHDKLFEQHATDRFDVATLEAYAGDLGLDEQLFRDCMLSGKYRSAIEKHNEEFRQIGATGTPTFLVGSELIGGAIPFNEMQKIIDGQLSQ